MRGFDNRIIAHAVHTQRLRVVSADMAIVVSRSQTLTRKAGEGLETLAYWVGANSPKNFWGR